jgi:hypothetical protein
MLYLFFLGFYFFMTFVKKRNRHKFLLVGTLIVITHSLMLYALSGEITAGSDADFYLANAENLHHGWQYFISARQYFPTSYYAYSIFNYLLSLYIDNKFLYVLLIRLTNLVLAAIILLFLDFKKNEFSAKLAKAFIYTVCIWLSLFNFRDLHIVCLTLLFFSIFFNTNKTHSKILLFLFFSAGLYFYRQEMIFIFLVFFVLIYFIKRFSIGKRKAIWLTGLLLLSFIPLALIKLPPPLDYLALRMLYNNEVDINDNTKLDFDPVKVYASGNTTTLGKVIVTRVYKRFPVIFFGYNPLIMTIDYNKAYNEKFGLTLSPISYLFSQMVFILYYFIFNPVLLAALFSKKYNRENNANIFLALLVTTLFYFSLYNVLLGSAQPRVTAPLTCSLIYIAYKSGFIEREKKLIKDISIYIMLPILILYFLINFTFKFIM